MSFHVILRESDGAMWQSFEAPTPTLPSGFSIPPGHVLVTFAAPPAASEVWDPETRTFAAPREDVGAILGRIAALLQEARAVVVPARGRR